MDKLGKYIIEKPLGEGGMGMVYLALDPVIGRKVAIKVIHQRVMSPSIKERFYREAQSVGRLSHENITTLFDVGEQDGDPFLVLELLGGTDLRKRMQAEPPLTLAEKLDIAEQICRGLQYAHANDVIHRDIKPDNIRVLDGGRVKIMDFGLARIETGTLTHSSMGTPRYMSPEQIRDAEVDHRTDIFSFGVLFYELLSGTNPFSGDRLSTIIYKIINEKPQPPTVDDIELSEGLQRIVARCIEKDPARRYPDFGAVLSALKDIRRPPSGELARTRTVAVGPHTDRHAEAPANAPAPGRVWYQKAGVVAAVIVGALVGTYALVQSTGGGGSDFERRLTEAEATPDASPAYEAGPLADSTLHLGDTAVRPAVVPEEASAGPPADEHGPEEPESKPRRSAETVDQRRQAQRAEAGNARAAMEDARLEAQARDDRADTVRVYQQAEVRRREGTALYQSGEYEAAVQQFRQAQRLYAEVEEPALEPEPTPPPVATADPSAAQQARDAMLSAKTGVPETVRGRSPFLEAVEEERRGEQSYAEERFDEAEAYFKSAAVRYEQAAALPTPREEVQRALLELTQRYERSLEAEDVDGLHGLNSYYARNTWRGFFDVVSDVAADVRYELEDVTADVAMVVVTVRLRYRNNKNEQQDNVLAYTWKLQKDPPERWVLADVATR